MLRLAALTAFCLAALCGARLAAADETTLIFATANAGESHPNALFMHPWAQAINADGKGVLNIDVRDGTAIANATNAYDRVLDDVIQIGWILQNDVAGKFPRSDVATLPFMARSSAEGSTALWRMYKAGILDAEYDTIHPLLLVALTPAGIHLTHPLKSLDVCGDSAWHRRWRCGVLDLVQSVQAGGVTSYHVDTTLGTSVAMIFMSKKKYSSLSPEVKKVLDAHAGEAASRAFGAWWDQERKDGKAQTIARGAKRTIVQLTDAQTAAWREKMKPLEAAWVARTPDGPKIIAAYRAALAKLQASAM